MPQRKLSAKTQKKAPIDTAVAGLGLMGRSIAACLLAAGHRVVGYTNDVPSSQQATRKVRSLLAEMRRQGLTRRSTAEMMGRFQVSLQIQDLASAGIVFESVTEDEQVKRQVFHAVEAVVARSAILATNTSAIPVTRLQEGMAHPERILGIHWDEPAHVTRFLEIIPGKQTKKRYMDAVYRLAPGWGKEPSLLRREIRGFISNRISYAMFREACYLVDSGVCTVEDVDRSLRNDVGWWSPFAGPFRYMDLMGPEKYERVMHELLPDLCTSPDVPLLMQRVIKAGSLGIANGKGFYKYSPREARQWEERFTEFNYKIRKLLQQFPEDSGRPRKPAEK